jgi:tRNA pseudouridine55 synthase
MSAEGKVLLIDKPTGITSHDVVEIIRKKTGIKRVGHAGTLDPLATGLLILLVGREATKRQTEFLKQEKTYECTVRLGLTTDTYDSDGKVFAQAPWEKLSQISRQDVENALRQFVGENEQTVPAYSAVKIHGKKLYERARKGEIDVTTLPSRKVHIYSVELTEFKKDEEKQILEVKFTVHCSSGTYIRSLAHDLGQALGVGGSVTALRRTKIGKFSIENTQVLENVIL